MSGVDLAAAVQQPPLASPEQDQEPEQAPYHHHEKSLSSSSSTVTAEFTKEPSPSSPSSPSPSSPSPSSPSPSPSPSSPSPSSPSPSSPSHPLQQQQPATRERTTHRNTNGASSPFRKSVEVEDTTVLDVRERLEQACSDGGDVQVLDLSTRGRVPKCKLVDMDILKLCRMTGLTDLNLNGNDVTDLPDAISNLLRLERIALNKNNLKQLPKNLDSLVNLRDLSARLNSIKHWPSELHKMGLIKIDFAFNAMSNLKIESGNSKFKVKIFGGGSNRDGMHSGSNSPLFHSLRSLDISFNQFTQFPVRVLEFVALEELNISRNEIQDLPPVIAKFGESLLTLRVDKCGFSQFPMAICELMSLEVLSLDENKIQRLPSASAGLNRLIKLKELYLNNCSLGGWSQLYCQAKLKKLHMSNNQIFSIPTEVRTMANLEDLKINKNQITDIPSHISQFNNIRLLDLSDNMIEDVDANIGSLSFLQLLDLHGNRIRALPAEFSNLENLTELNLSKNMIIQMPDVSKMTKLQTWDMSDNLLEELPEGIEHLVKLEHLDMTMNRLEVLPSALYSLPKLSFLRLKHNAISELHEDIQYLRNLEELNMDNNELVALPSSITSLRRLKKLSMNYNCTYSPPEEIVKWQKRCNVELEYGFDFADRIIPGVYIGGANAAACARYMQELGVTHILTAATAIPPRHTKHFKYMIIHLEDVRSASLRYHFDETFEFIEEGRQAGGCMIHCMAGRSRSATVATAYLMKYKKIRLKQAFKFLQKARPEVIPNPTFRTELNKYDKEMFEGVVDETEESARVLNRVVHIDNGQVTEKHTETMAPSIVTSLSSPSTASQQHKQIATPSGKRSSRRILGDMFSSNISTSDAEGNIKSGSESTSMEHRPPRRPA